MGSRIICVTGGAGFIGSHVAAALVDAGHRVLIVDDLSTGSKENVPEGAEFFDFDIRSHEAAALITKSGVEVLVHHAAQIDLRRSVLDPVGDTEVNVVGTLRLVEAGRRGALRQVIFASTGGAMYGEQERFPADEEHPARPLSPYGIAKLAVERYLAFYHAEYGIDVASLRYANVYGERQNPYGEAGVVAIFLDHMLTGRDCVINGDGHQTRDYVYVGDVVDANLAVLGREGLHVYNVGTGIETDVLEIHRQLAAATGTDREPIFGPPKAGEQRRSCISSARLEAELGVRPRVPLDEGLRRTAAWFAARRQ